LLTEGAARINPLAFGQTIRLKNYVHHIATHFGLAEVWQFDLAAMLSQLGCVTLPAETLEKVYTGQSLSPEEQQTFLAHPDVGQLLLQHIPRLETIAAMIAGQHRPGPLSASPQTLVQRAPAVLGAHLLKVALGFDQCVMCGMASAHAVEALLRHPHIYEAAVVVPLQSLAFEGPEVLRRAVTVRALCIGMVLDEDVRTHAGLLVAAQGYEVTDVLRGTAPPFCSERENRRALPRAAPIWGAVTTYFLRVFGFPNRALSKLGRISPLVLGSHVARH
jgi:hypothetical protein